jgi:phenylpropionate dioxygenase-like ring-hydroxylating dioxygenase large terminal subunit
VIPNQWYAILPSKAVKTNQIVGVKRLNLDLALFRNEKGDIGCVVDQCTHRGRHSARGLSRGLHPVPLSRAAV